MKNIVVSMISRLPFPYTLWYVFIKGVLYFTACLNSKKSLYFVLKLSSDLDKVIEFTATRYGGGLHPKHRLTKYHDFFVENINSQDKVLDIGCGCGAVAFSIAEKTGSKVVGVDISVENISDAQRMHSHPGITYVCEDATILSQRESFDVIVLSNVLEHIEHRVDLLQAVQKQCNPKKWLIRVPILERNWSVPMRMELGMPYFSDRTHFTEYTEISFREEMRCAGFNVLSLQIRWSEIWAVVADSPSA